MASFEERQQARERYDRAIEEGYRAAITEEERPGVFTMRVGNIMPNERATVRLTLTGPLPYDEGEATFRFPLVVAPRYIPGTPLGGEDVGVGVALDTDAVPDASRISPPVLLPGFPNPVRLALSAEIRDAHLPLSNLRSALHAVVERSSDGGRRIEIQPSERLDRDFILRWKLAENDVRTSLLLKPDASGDQGTFLLTLVPPALAEASKPRDIVFVLDRSGSMAGWKMIAARRAVARMVDTLSDRDRFSVAAFDNRIEFPPDLGSNLVDATDRNRFRAIEFLAGVDAAGGTEMAAPLQHAASQLAGGYQDRERAIVLVTDGQVGNEDQILRMLSASLRNVRVFCVGIDQAVNSAFLRRLADMGGGLAERVESEDRLDEVMDRVHRRIGTPVLTELSLAGQDLALDAVAPHRLPDLFAGAPVLIGGRYRGRGGAIRLFGSDTSGRSWSDTIRAHESSNDAIATIWAKIRIRDLEDRYLVARDPALEREIVSTSLRWSVLSRFTAFVAVDQTERVNPGGRVEQLVQPVDAPAGWGMFGAEVPLLSEAKRSGQREAPAARGQATTASYGCEPINIVHERLSASGAASPPPGPVVKASSLDLFGGESRTPGQPYVVSEYAPKDAKPKVHEVPKPAPMPEPRPQLNRQIDSDALRRRRGPARSEGSNVFADRREAGGLEPLLDDLGRTSDPVAAAHLLVHELPAFLDQLRSRLADDQMRELEQLLAKLADPRATKDQLGTWVLRAIELIDPKTPSRSRGSFWR